MDLPDFQVTVLGTRGSVATGNAGHQLYGGDTSCYMVRAGEETIFLDAGTGLVSAPSAYPRPPVILLSHLHLDHVIGLGMFPLLSKRGQKIKLYVPFSPCPEAASSLLDRLFSPPFWPLKLREYESDLEILPVPPVFQIGDLRVETMKGCHPGDSLIYKLIYMGKSVVYATDYEHEERSFCRLAAFSSNADLLLYDAQFCREDYDRKKGFGHSTAQKGLEIMALSGAKRLLLIHHDPQDTDDMLRKRERALGRKNTAFAREGQVITL